MRQTISVRECVDAAVQKVLQQGVRVNRIFDEAVTRDGTAAFVCSVKGTPGLSFYLDALGTGPWDSIDFRVGEDPNAPFDYDWLAGPRILAARNGLSAYYSCKKNGTGLVMTRVSIEATKHTLVFWGCQEFPVTLSELPDWHGLSAIYYGTTCHSEMADDFEEIYVDWDGPIARGEPGLPDVSYTAVLIEK